MYIPILFHDSRSDSEWLGERCLPCPLDSTPLSRGTGAYGDQQLLLLPKTIHGTGIVPHLPDMSPLRIRTGTDSGQDRGDPDQTIQTRILRATIPVPWMVSAWCGSSECFGPRILRFETLYSISITHGYTWCLALLAKVDVRTGAHFSFLLSLLDRE